MDAYAHLQWWGVVLNTCARIMGLSGMSCDNIISSPLFCCGLSTPLLVSRRFEPGCLEVLPRYDGSGGVQACRPADYVTVPVVLFLAPGLLVPYQRHRVGVPPPSFCLLPRYGLTP